MLFAAASCRYQAMFFCIGIISGFAVLHHLPFLPPITPVLWCLLVSVLWWVVSYYRHWYGLYSTLFLGFMVAWALGIYQAEARLADTLAPQHDNKVSRVRLTVTSIAVYGDSTIQFDAKVWQGLSGLPTSIRVMWNIGKSFNLYKAQHIADKPVVVPGQMWEMSLLFKQPNTLLNPGGFDYETYLFRENIRAIATVKGQPLLLKQEDKSLAIYIQRIRHRIRAAMQPYVENKRYGAILIALVMGDQNSISTEDWQMFNKTGISHLVSISGSHITMLSALAIALTRMLSKCFRYKAKNLADYVDLQKIAVIMGVLVALAYCLLAGWGVPAQRTFLMLCISAIFFSKHIKQSLLYLFIWVATGVLLLDSWSILSPGFYLSFAAVAVLHQVLSLLQEQHYQPLNNWAFAKKIVKKWIVLQGAITLALSPFLIIFFNQVSLISPLVNAYAVFLVGMVITPLALLLGFLCLVNPWQALNQALAEVSHFLLAKVMHVSEILSQLSWASLDFPTPPVWTIGLALLGIVLWLLPKGLPFKYWSLAFLFPLFVFADKPLHNGQWQMWALDIGQGGAVIVKTAHHSLLFDTGVRVSPHNESGQRVLLPAFRALGMDKLDALIVSHSDMDHVGGLSTLVENIWIEKVYASFQVDAFIDKEERILGKKIGSLHKNLLYQACRGEFSWDGVTFVFLHPWQTTLPIKASNELSCVLAIKGKFHTALLTGDITVREEQQLDITQHYDVVQVPHHGSKSSSSTYFINKVNATLVFAQTGFQNRFHHPHHAIRNRWLQAHAQWFNTAQTGAITIYSDEVGLHWQTWRQLKKRYWHRQLTVD